MEYFALIEVHSSNPDSFSSFVFVVYDAIPDCMGQCYKKIRYIDCISPSKVQWNVTRTRLPSTNIVVRELPGLRENRYDH